MGDGRCAQRFDPFSMDYSGPIMRGVPLYMVHSMHYSAALAEARALATAVACRRAGLADASPAPASFNVMSKQIAQCADVGALASLVASWGEPILAEQVISRQAEADWGLQMQAMLREQAGWTDLGGPTWVVAEDRSCDPSFHFEPGIAIRLRWSPLLSDYLCGERSTWPSQHESCAAEQVEQPLIEGGGEEAYGDGREANDDEHCPSCPRCGSESISWVTRHDWKCYDCDYTVHQSEVESDDESYDDYFHPSQVESDDD